MTSSSLQKVRRLAQCLGPGSGGAEGCCLVFSAIVSFCLMHAVFLGHRQVDVLTRLRGEALSATELYLLPGLFW